MLAFLIYALLVVLVCAVLIYVLDLLIGMLPAPPANLRVLVRIIIVLMGVLLIIDRALPLLGSPRLLL